MKKLTGLTLLVVAFLTVSMGLISARADKYGAGAITDLFSSLFNAFWPLIALLFIVGIIMAVFGAPYWLKRVFGWSR